MSPFMQKIAKNTANLSFFAWIDRVACVSVFLTHKRYAYIFAAFLVLAVLSGCAEEGPTVVTDEAVLVEVGQTAIRVVDYRQFIARVAPELRAEYGAKQLLEAIVEQTLLVQEAERQGLGKSAEFLQWQAQAQARLVQQALYKRAGIVQPDVSEEALRTYFQRSPLQPPRTL